MLQGQLERLEQLGLLGLLAKTHTPQLRLNLQCQL
jgi:hypothetical protein